MARKKYDFGFGQTMARATAYKTVSSQGIMATKITSKPMEKIKPPLTARAGHITKLASTTDVWYTKYKNN